MILKNKTAVITGCSKGIGLAILNKFSENSCNIISCTRFKNQEFSDLKLIRVLARFENIKFYLPSRLKDQYQIWNFFGAHSLLNIEIVFVLWAVCDLSLVVKLRHSFIFPVNKFLSFSLKWKSVGALVPIFV